MIETITQFLTSEGAQQIIGIAFPIVCVISAYVWFKKTHWLRLIKDTPTSRIHSAAQGSVELVGHADFLNESPLVSPLTGRSCVWYHYRIEERDDDDDDTAGSNWTVIDEKTSGDLFVIKDETGQCVIDPDDAQVMPYNSQRWFHSQHYQGKEPLPKPKGIFTKQEEYRYFEEWIEDDEPLFALGHFSTEGTGETLPDLKDEIKEILKTWQSNPKKYLARFGIEKLEGISQPEWEKIKAVAKKVAEGERAKRPILPSANVLRKPQDRRQGFLISSLNEEELISHFKRDSLLSLIICIICGTFGFPLLFKLIFL